MPIVHWAHMISIKKFLTPEAEEKEAFLQAMRVVVRCIGDHAGCGEDGESTRFRESIRRIADALNSEISPNDLLVQAGGVVRALEDRMRLAAARSRQQAIELQNMLTMLTSTIGILSSAGRRALSASPRLKPRSAAHRSWTMCG